jgi:hypothetical protein
MSGGLSSTVQANCQTSDFVAAPAPTKSYEIDVNIDVGPVGLSKGGLLSAIQDAFVIPVWNTIEWVVHGLVVLLEWGYTLNLLSGPTMSGVARALRHAQASFTQPWLALVLAVASMLTIYNGLIRRRVTDTLGHALVTTVMMAAGLWIIADPLGTIGAVGQWADQASLGTLGAVAQGTPSNAPRTLADSMRTLFEGAIEMPWCYLEFGNVRWCSDPALLDPRLRKAGLQIEARQKAMIGCKPRALTQLCAAPGSPAALLVERSDRLMRQAGTNGAIFLAFPANGPERNSVTESGSLFHVLCQASNDTRCTGLTAAQAEFRSAGGTFPRMIGLALIAAGVLGMAMLFGLIALRLFSAALVGVFMLLLAPAAVLAPALGDGGRAVFGAWLQRLLGAVGSKLFYSFLLGVLLMMQRLLTSLQSLGWWTQWLLISTFWWAVFLKRHQAAAFLQSRGRQPASPEHRPIGRRIESVRQAHRAVRHPMTWTKGKILGQVSATEQLAKRPSVGHAAGGRERPSIPRMFEQTSEPNRRGSARERRAQRKVARRARLAMLVEPEVALADGEGASTAMLTARIRGNQAGSIGKRQSRHDARRVELDVDGSRPLNGAGHVREQPEGSEWPKQERKGEDSVSGIARATKRLIPGGERLIPGGENVLTGGSSQRRVPERDRAASGPHARSSQATVPLSQVARSNPPEASTGARETRSSVMDDARAVAERRKRQLGFERPSGPKPPGAQNPPSQPESNR